MWRESPGGDTDLWRPQQENEGAGGKGGMSWYRRTGCEGDQEQRESEHTA